MSENKKRWGASIRSAFLNERVMGATCAFFVVTCLITLYFYITSGSTFEVFQAVVKLAVAVWMYLAFRFYKWDIAKGLMGGALFSLMYQEAFLVLSVLWEEEMFDFYLMVGVQGSVYLAASGMTLLMTIIITINHFFINYSQQGNVKNVMLNRVALTFKFAVYVILFIANVQLDLPAEMLWQNAMLFLTDISLLMLIVSVESQLDSFKVLLHEMLQQKQAGEALT